ncbi:MAG: Gfo/Idh/MocA family oxidoreductase [Clostridia bacterium]
MKVKVGIVGTGNMGKCHSEALRRLGFVEVVASYSEGSIEHAKKRADDLLIPQGYADFGDFIQHPELQVVHICTPNHLHYQQTKLALLAGKHVICEKPLAMTLAEGEELTSLAESKGLVHAVHFNWSFFPMMHETKARIKKGDLGELVAFNCSFLQDWLFDKESYDWRMETEYTGHSRVVSDLGSHCFQLLEWMTGNKIRKILAKYKTIYPIRDGKEINNEDLAFLLLEMDNGALGQMQFNQCVAGAKSKLAWELQGTKMSISWNSYQPNQLELGFRQQPNQLLQDPALYTDEAKALGGFLYGLSDTSRALFAVIYDKILGTEKYQTSYPDFNAGVRTLYLCQKAYDAQKADKWLCVES